MTDQHTPLPADAEKMNRVIAAIRIFGIFLLIAAVFLAIDAGSIGSALGLDATTRKVLASLCAIMGITDCLVVPYILRRGSKDPDKVL